MSKYLHKTGTDDGTYKETKTTASLRVHFLQSMQRITNIIVHLLFLRRLK